MPQPSESPAFRVEETPEGVRVVIPARRRAGNLLSLGVWFVLWSAAGVYALTSDTAVVPHAGSGFVVWMVLWAVGILFGLGSLLWQLDGSEVITVDREMFTHQAVAFGLGRERAYRLTEISHWRCAIAETTLASTRRHGQYMPPWATSYGSLAFDHKGRPVRFAPSLDEAQALRLLQVLRSRVSGSAPA